MGGGTRAAEGKPPAADLLAKAYRSRSSAARGRTVIASHAGDFCTANGSAPLPKLMTPRNDGDELLNVANYFDHGLGRPAKEDRRGRSKGTVGSMTTTTTTTTTT